MINVNQHRYFVDFGTGLADSDQVAAIKYQRQVIRVDGFDLPNDLAGAGEKSVNGRNRAWVVHRNFFVQLFQRQA